MLIAWISRILVPTLTYLSEIIFQYIEDYVNCTKYDLHNSVLNSNGESIYSKLDSMHTL